MKAKLTLSVLALLTAVMLFFSTESFAAKISQEQIIEVVKQRSATVRTVPDEAYRAALDSLKGTKTLMRLIEMTKKVNEFEELANTPVPSNFNNVNEFRKFKELIKEKLNPLNWLLDVVTPKWISFISDTKEVFSALKADILERALKESAYQSYKQSRDAGNDMYTAYDEEINRKAFYVIRSSEQYKNLPDSEVNKLLMQAMEERYKAEKYAEFILELRVNKNKHIAQIIRPYDDAISTLYETAKKIAEQTQVNLSGTWTVNDSAGRFNGTMTLDHIDFTTVIGKMQTPAGIINVYGGIEGKTIRLQFEFYGANLIDYYLRYPELSNYIASKGGVMATVILSIEDSRDYYSGTLYPWYVVYNDSSDGLVVKKIVYGTVEESGTPRSISIARR
ncbi:hypothetical protein ACSFC1_03350 [Pseudothermotoga sp. U03pept]|uniref:hypothetical protein n=1 Tax=Pseudothermotoga sp. U03pept TaxID=3447012 RepID=UPI003F106E9D